MIYNELEIGDTVGYYNGRGEHIYGHILAKEYSITLFKNYYIITKKLFNRMREDMLVFVMEDKILTKKGSNFKRLILTEKTKR